jgi:hypothetical protein
MSGADFIAGLEQGLSNTPPVQEGPIAALQVPEAASLVGTFKGKMQARDRLIERKRNVRVFAPPNAQELIVR